MICGFNKAWEATGQNIKLSSKETQLFYELKQLKPLFGEGCTNLLE
jgi:hypothetical protein